MLVACSCLILHRTFLAKRPSFGQLRQKDNMLRPLAALLAVSAGAEAHRMRLGENGHGVRGFVAPAEGKPEEHHRPGQPGRMGGWFDRMGAARDALQAQGMEFSWEPSSQGGRAVTFVDGESVACIATSPSAAHNDDTVVLIAGS